MFFEFLVRIEHWARFKQCDMYAEIGQYVSRCCPASTGPDYYDVMNVDTWLDR